VNFSLPCNQRPTWLLEGPLPQKFDLIRDNGHDEELTEFMSAIDQSTGKITNENASPIWTRVPGTEHEKLPFGQIVHAYRSIALPLAPVV